MTPDTKDWTWVLSRPCPECGFAAASLTRDQLAPTLRSAAAALQEALTWPTVGQRPDPGTWSPLEYGCHVRDVYRIFLVRLNRILTEDDPLFANWDQDDTAVADRYDTQDPQAVSRELDLATDALVAGFADVPEDAWSRSGRRSDGAQFTVTTLSQYLAHDPVHHAWDIAQQRR